MSHLGLIKQLDHKPNRERLEIIKRGLQEFGIAILEQKYVTGINLIVDLGVGTERIGIGSHFDRVAESGGANDNGSAIAVCFDIIKKFLDTNDLDIGLRIFFFDEEETGLKGSATYARNHGIADLLGLINMELVGLGDQFALWPVPSGATGPVLETFERASAGMNIVATRFDQIVTNTADHVPFRKAGLMDSFTVTCISLRDIEVAKSYYTALNLGVPRENLFSILSDAPVFQHYHQPTDTFEKLSEKSIDMTSAVIWETILKVSNSPKDG